MSRKEIGTGWDRNNRNSINGNFKELYNIQDRAIAEATESVINDSKLIWQEPISTYNDIATTYPSPQNGWTVMTRDTGKVFRFFNGFWSEIQQIDVGPVNELDSRLTSQLAHKAHQIDNQYGNDKGPLVTIVTDDGQKTDYTIWYEQIFKPEGVPATSAVITDWVDNDPNMCTTGQLKEMYDNGWSIVSHTNTHIDADTATDSDLEKDLIASKNWLIQKGFDHDLFVAPFGRDTKSLREFSRKYFRCLVSIPSVAGWYNGSNGAIDNYRLKRIDLGDYGEPIANIKQRIDYAVEHNMWIIFMGHSWTDYYKTGNGVAEVREIIQYIKSKGVPIVNLRDGLRMKGNVVDYGDRVDPSEPYIKLNGDYGLKTSPGMVNDGYVTKDSVANSYLKIGTVKIKYPYTNAGFSFSYQALGFKDIGKVSFSVRTGSTVGTQNYIKLTDTREDKESGNGIVEFIAVQTEISASVQVYELYAKANVGTRRLWLRDFSILEEVPNLDAEVQPSEILLGCKGEWVAQLPTGTQLTATMISSQTVQTYLPTIYGKSSAGVFTYTSQIGRYTIKDNIVTVFIQLQGSFDTSVSGALRVSLPIKASLNNKSSALIGYQTGFSTQIIGGYTNVGSNEIALQKMGANGSTDFDTADIRNIPINLWIEMTYEI